MKFGQTVLIIISLAVLGCEESFAASQVITPQQASSAGGIKQSTDSARDRASVAISGEKSQREKRHFKAQAKGVPSIKDHAVRLENQSSAERRMTAGSRGESRPGPPRLDGTQKVVLGAAPALRSFGPNRSLTQPLATTAHRGTNPPMVAGIASTSQHRAMAIDGTRVQRKP